MARSGRHRHPKKSALSELEALAIYLFSTATFAVDNAAHGDLPSGMAAMAHITNQSQRFSSEFFLMSLPIGFSRRGFGETHILYWCTVNLGNKRKILTANAE